MNSRKYFKLMIYVLGAVTLSHQGISQELRFMTYNIRYDNPDDQQNKWRFRSAAMVELIKEYHPSVLGIQEGLYHQVAYLDSALASYTYVGVGRDDGMQKGEYSALFFDSTQVKCLQTSTFWLSNNPEQISVGWDAAMERICTIGLFEDLGAKERFWVFNTHFDHQGERAREQSAALIVSKINELNSNHYPVVLTGDFNAQPGDPPIEVIRTLMEDAMELSPSKGGWPKGTFNGFDNRPIVRRIDYIFTKGFEVEEYLHIDKRRSNNLHISDHLPVFVRIRQKTLITK